MKKYKLKFKRSETLMGYFKNRPVSDPYEVLAAEIVIAAVCDWRELIKKKAWDNPHPERYCNLDELRRFFKSEWCDFLLMNFDIDQTRILALLEQELAEAKAAANDEHIKK